VSREFSLSGYNMRVVVGIDIGLLNLGLVCLEYNNDYTEQPKAKFADKINLKLWECKKNKNSKCSLQHDKSATCFVLHFLSQYKKWFEQSHVIIIERQPPCGMKDIEQVFYTTLQSNRGIYNSCLSLPSIKLTCDIKLIHPKSMHKHFGIGHLSYEKRKEKTVGISHAILKNLDSFIDKERQHDISDACCLILFYVESYLKPHAEKKRYRCEAHNLMEWFRKKNLEINVTAMLSTFCYKKKSRQSFRQK